MGRRHYDVERMTASSAINAVLFDLDGTLLDTLPDLLHALNGALESVGRPTITRELLLPAVSAGTRSMLACAAPDAGPEEIATLRERFLGNYAASLGAHTQSFDGMNALLEMLLRRRIPHGVVTNKLERYTEPLLCKLNLRARFDCVICGDTTAKPKPSPLPLLAAAKALNLRPEQAVYIGDSPGDVHAANAAAMPVLIAGWGYLDPADDPSRWGEATLVSSPADIGDWLARHGVAGG